MPQDVEQTGATGTEGTQSAPATGTQGTTAADSTGTNAGPAAKPTGFSYQEDRSKWIPPHRLNEVSERARTLEAQIAERDRKIAALAGVQAPDPNAEKSEQVRNAFFQMFPQFKHLASLSDEQMKALIQSPEQAGRATQIEERHWQQHGKAVLNSIYTQVADAYGSDALSAEQQSDLQNSFAPWFSAKCRAELQASNGESSPTLDRYENNDPKLIEEFVKRVTNNWVEPARRKVTQQTLTRTRPMVNSQGRSQVTQVQRPESFKDLDARIEHMTNIAKNAGASFGR